MKGKRPYEDESQGIASMDGQCAPALAERNLRGKAEKGRMTNE
jgi:hypothetical protein